MNRQDAKDAKRNVKTEMMNGSGHGASASSQSPDGMNGLLDDLTALDLARMTPLEAIAMLDRVQRRARLVLGAPTTPGKSNGNRSENP